MKITDEKINNSNIDIFGSWINKPEELTNKFNSAQPFEYIIINNFLKDDIAEKISNEYPQNLNEYHKYDNPLEIKYAYDNIDNMSKNIKNVFFALCSNKIIDAFKIITDNDKIEYDPTCHGGGLHIHPNNGRLHMHLDYEKHPILENKQRYLNIILYLTKDWDQSWGGQTELWNKDMLECIVKSNVEFNTALIFKTTEKSWHGLPEPIKCPDDKYRKTLAFYYLVPLESNNDNNNNKKGAGKDGYRTKAVFTKRPQDAYDPLIEKLYKIRPHRRIIPEDLKI
jgi:Rps23 Pro-64 3,4-dihydroxylase Tpa1-like proline 4-hydroxylase